MIAPPFLVSYSSLDDYLRALGPESCELRKRHENEIKCLVEKGLPPIVSPRCLAVLFGYSTGFVQTLSQNSWKYYRTFTISQGKKRRKIQAPKVALKVIQKWFGYHLSDAVAVDDNVFGFIPGKSAPAAAMQHVNAKWVYSVDIKDFFPSTPKDVVEKALIQTGYSDVSAFLLSGLLCYKNALAQGSPASPILSNLVFMEMDLQLKNIADENNVRFTRYADDIVFSGKEEFPENIKGQVKDLFKDTCWDLSDEKEYYAEIPKRLKVHGLLVHGDKPRLTKGYRNKIRAYKHLLSKERIKEDDISRIKGHVKYAESIDRLGE